MNQKNKPEWEPPISPASSEHTPIILSFHLLSSWFCSLLEVRPCPRHQRTCNNVGVSFHIIIVLLCNGYWKIKVSVWRCFANTPHGYWIAYRVLRGATVRLKWLICYQNPNCLQSQIILWGMFKVLPSTAKQNRPHTENCLRRHMLWENCPVFCLREEKGDGVTQTGQP